MGQHVVLDLVLGQACAAVPSKFVAAPVFNIYAFPAVLKLLLFTVAGKVVAADRALDQGGKDVGIIASGSVCFRRGDLPELLKFRPGDVRLAVVGVVFVPAGVGLVFKSRSTLLQEGARSPYFFTR